MKAREMTIADVPRIVIIEKESFATPWSQEAFRTELTTNSLARYLVLEEGDQIIAYGGYWQILDEGHITNIAVAANQRGKGYGRAILEALIRDARSLGVQYMTLEVRRSNAPAIALYESFGFTIEGVRENYYQAEQEDALILWCEV